MRRFELAIVIAVIGLCGAGFVSAQEPALPAAESAEPAIESVAPSAAGAADLKFREMFRLPVGPRGLEPTPKLLQMEGRVVRIVGYMVEQESMRSFILAPLPLKLGDEDESLADDLPPGVVFVHLAERDEHLTRHIPGLLELTGVLAVGGFAEADGRVSSLRLTLDTAMSQEVVHRVRK